MACGYAEIARVKAEEGSANLEIRGDECGEGAKVQVCGYASTTRQTANGGFRDADSARQRYGRALLRWLKIRRYNKMRLSKPALLLFLVFIFTVVQGEAVTNERVVVSKSSTTVGRGGCEKQGFECKEGNGGLEDTVLENEDYIYTNSLP
ncbi:hypothetical protein E2542_SST02671 [Spatholobus suberectus]|nr:hypothetical protein E2542_SST02671 [Spatholobus suberectus]